MTMNYRLADMLSLIRNGQSARLANVSCQATNLLGGVLEVLKNEGFISGYSKIEDAGKVKFDIELKYHEGEKVIKEITCISKPGRRVYSEISKLPKFFNGLGIAILSTSHGIMSDFEARKANVGGEVLCSVF